MALDLQNKSKEMGKSDDIAKAIEKIQKDIAEGQKLTNLSPEEFKNYSELIEKKTKFEKDSNDLNLKKTLLEQILTELRNSKTLILGSNKEEDFIKGNIDRIIDQLPDNDTAILEIKNKIVADYSSMISNFEIEVENLNLSEKIKLVTAEIEKLNIYLKPFLVKLEGQKELNKLTSNLEIETKKLNDAKTTEKQFAAVLEDYKNLRNRTANMLKERIDAYENIVNKINSTRKEIGSGVTLNSNLIFKQNDFPLFHQTNKASISKGHFFNRLFSDGYLIYNQIPDFYVKPLFIKDEKFLKISGDDTFDLPINQGYSLEEVLRGLIKDSFFIDYSVTYKGDDLLRMSPGKKGTVLLILFLQISSSEYPILIDQPEDNLDNRTIYELLCAMIKEKKKERQIIIVSHNANLVVATDSENIIVANQSGQDSIGDNSKYQFEYISGSIEHTQEFDDSINEFLYKQGIREHICDILEGGNEAFKNRERKYSIRN